jgi:hypothetical protein
VISGFAEACPIMTAFTQFQEEDEREDPKPNNRYDYEEERNQDAARRLR